MYKPMTRMSESSQHMPSAPDRKRLQSRGRSCLARAVHEASWIVGISLCSVPVVAQLAGCVIPPSLEVETQDAAVNSPPAIVSVTSDQQALPDPGPVVFDMGATAGDLSITLIDTDTGDDLFVKIFVDYNFPDRLDARAQCQAPAPASSSSSPMRTATCKLNALCVTADLGVQRNMTVVVFDRRPLPPGEGDPPFQGMPQGGLSTQRFYFLKCQPPQT
jgi:hypothetical protein